MDSLTESQKIRYRRNLLVPEIGIEGQKKIINGRVLVVGAGGLGSPALFYLASAGVGTIGIVDSDRVELSNLQRQILYSTSDLDRLKTTAAGETLSRLNPDIHIELYSDRFTLENGKDIVQGYDFVIEATDNFESKFLLNDICVQERIPHCHAGILGMFGQIMTILPGKGACYRCVFGDLPETGEVETTAEAGVLGTVPGVLGAVQASEAIKYLVGCGDLLVRRLITYDALSSKFREIPLPAPSCGVCKEAGLTE